MLGSLRGIVLLSGGVSILSAQIFTLQDGTPVRLRLMKTVSSADSHAGETVDFEVAEPVVSQGLVVIPKDSLALGKITKAEPKRRFGRGGELEISIDSVRLADGSRAQLRATPEKGLEPMGGGRLAATIAASPIMVWVKGKDVAFQRGTEVTAYLNGDARLDEAQLRKGMAPPAQAPSTTTTEATAERAVPSGVLTNADIIAMRRAGLSEEVILAKIRNSPADFRTGTQDLIQLKEAGLSDAAIALIVEKAGSPR
jgi:hypothetical protein